MNTEKHTYLIEHIFKTFFPGVEYVVEPENSLSYLYNIRLTNVLHKLFDPNEFVPRYTQSPKLQLPETLTPGAVVK